MAAHDPVTRVLRLFTLLNHIASRRSGRRLGRRELADACECSVKTVSRDLDLLQAARIPVDFDRDEEAYTLPDKGWSLTTATLTAADVTALALALSLLARSDPASPLSDQIQTALDKVTAGLNPVRRRQMQQIQAVIQQPGRWARDYSQAPLDLLIHAAEQKRTAEIYYDSARSGRLEWRNIDPYRLDQRLGRFWDIQAWCHRENKVKTFALNRVQEARLTDTVFEERPWDDSDEGVLSGFRDGEWVEVEVRFAPEAVRYARDRLWNFEVELEPQPDGVLILRGRVRGLEGIVCELLSWRRLVQVLGGPELRARMVEEIKAMAALYAAPEKV